MKHTIRHIHKKARSLFCLLGMLAVTVAGYGQNDIKEMTFINEVGQQPVHEKVEYIYLAPGDTRDIEVYGDANQIINQYIKWYSKNGDITDIISKQGGYNLYKDKGTGKKVYYVKDAGRNNEQQRFVTIKAPDNFGENTEIVVYCDLSRFASTEGANTINVPQLSLRRKYVIRHASKMAAAIEAYNENKEQQGSSIAEKEKPFLLNVDIHTSCDAGRFTLRLPAALSNYYLRKESVEKENGEYEQPEYLFWKFYKKGNEANPVYSVTVKEFTDDAYHGFIRGSSIKEISEKYFTLYSYVLNVEMSELISNAGSMKSSEEFVVKAFVASDNEGKGSKQILTINLSIDPNMKGMTDKELDDIDDYNNPLYIRKDEILNNELYYKPLGKITFDDDGTSSIKDAGGNSQIESLDAHNNTGVVPLPESNSDYAFSDYNIEGNSYIGTPARNEYAFLRSIGIKDVSNHGLQVDGADNAHKYEWWINNNHVYDRTYKDNQKKYGFFMYVDADESPGLITQLPMENVTLCPQTQIIVTAWVCNLVKRNEQTFSIDNIKAGESELVLPTLAGTDLCFTFKNKEGDILYKYYTGELNNNVRGGKSGQEAEWQQIYMSFTIPSTVAAVDNRYILEVASNCLHSDGGDFAIDDICVYMSLPSVNVFQTNMCDETSDILIRANFDLLLKNIGLGNSMEEEAIPTWSEESYTQFGNDDDHGYNPRHYHMYYTIAEKHTLESGEVPDVGGCEAVDKTGWISGTKGNYWKYLYLNYGGSHGQEGSNSEQAYGTVIISANYADMPDRTTRDAVIGEGTGSYNGQNIHSAALDGLAWTASEDGSNVRYVIFDELNINSDVLELGKEYYIQVFPHKMDGRRPLPNDKCAIANTFKIEKSHTVYVDSKPIESNPITAGSTLKSDLKILDLSIPNSNEEGHTSQWVTIKNMYFDWYLGSVNEKIPGSSNVTVGEALKAFRVAYPDMKELNSVNKPSANDPFTEEMADFIEKSVIENKLFLYENSFKVTETMIQNYSAITLSPVGLVGLKSKLNEEEGGVQFDPATWEPNEENIYMYCQDPQEISLLPSMRPASFNSSIRIGSWQLKVLKNSGDKYLRIPVFSATAVLEPTTDNKVKLIKIDDKSVEQTEPVATLKCLEMDGEIQPDNTGNDKISKLNPITNYLDLQFKEYGFLEGHTYTVQFEYQRKESMHADGLSQDNNLTTELNIKVVPEYLTWNGSKSSDWNNDANWERSNRKDDLYFGDSDPTDQGDALTFAFAPMKGSYVTMKKGAKDATVLQELDEGKNGRGLGAAFVLGLENNDIQYEVVAEDPGSTTSTDPWDTNSQSRDNDGGNRYYAISYYGNWCNEIYFKPEAMLQYQQRLTYDKAWVDFELTPKRWYLLSSPLQDVVSGDMYLPADEKHFGRQTTKAFAPIHYNYSNTGTTIIDGIDYYGVTNNRFNPAVYQRTWNGTAINYYLGSSQNSSNLIIEGDWSNLHNDVYKPYTTGTGFSVGVQLRDPKEVTGDKTLFRLPKADEQYKIQMNSTGNNYGESITDDTPNRDNSGRLSKIEDNGSISISLTEGNSDKYLIGNPFMAMLDMKGFFEANGFLKTEYRVLAGKEETAIMLVDGKAISNVADAEQSTTIAPLQGFFVEKANTSTRQGSDEVSFNTSMTTVKVTDVNSPTLRSAVAESETGNSFPKLYISAEREGLRSSTVVACREEASTGFKEGEDMDSMLDPDREEVPMVYTLAGNKAVIINSTPDLHNIPLGVYSSSTKPVILRFTGMEAFDAPIYLYDAETKSAIELNDEQAELTIPGNTHGRYFLRSDYVPTDNDVVKAKGAISIYSMMPGQVIVSSVDPLTRILVYNLSGQLVSTRTDLHTPTAYLDGLNPGQIYIVRAETADQVQTEKVEVR